MAIGASEISNLFNRGRARFEAAAKFGGKQINSVVQSEAAKSAGSTIKSAGEKAVQYGTGKFEAAKPLVKQALNPEPGKPVIPDVRSADSLAVPTPEEVVAAAIIKGPEQPATRAEIMAADLESATPQTYKDQLQKTKEKGPQNVNLDQDIHSWLNGMGSDRNEAGQRRREYDTENTKKRFEQADTQANLISQYLGKDFSKLDDTTKNDLRGKFKAAIESRHDALSERLAKVADPNAEIDRILQQKELRTIVEANITALTENKITNVMGDATEGVSKSQLGRNLADVDLEETQRLIAQNTTDLARFSEGAPDAVTLKSLQDSQVQRTLDLATKRSQLAPIEEAITRLKTQGSGDKDKKIADLDRQADPIKAAIKADEIKDLTKTSLENAQKQLQAERAQLQKDLLNNEDTVRQASNKVVEAQDTFGDSLRLQGKYDQRAVDQLDELLGDAVNEYLDHQALALLPSIESRLQTEAVKAERQTEDAFRQQIMNRYEQVFDRKDRFGSGTHREIKTDKLQIKKDYKTLMSQGQEGYITELRILMKDRPDFLQILDTQEGQQLAIQQLLAFKDGAGNGISKGDKVHILTDEKHQKWSQPLVEKTKANDPEAKQEMDAAGVKADLNTPEYKRQVEDAVYNRPDFFSTIMFGSLVSGSLFTEASKDEEKTG
jgi:hypothetical protein